MIINDRAEFILFNKLYSLSDKILKVNTLGDCLRLVLFSGGRFFQGKNFKF